MHSTTCAACIHTRTHVSRLGPCEERHVCIVLHVLHVYIRVHMSADWAHVRSGRSQAAPHAAVSAMRASLSPE